MARPKTLENRTELILEAADELFARYGYERTSMEDIARHLNIGKGSIYLEFNTKEEILITLLRRHAHSMFEFMQNKVENSSGSPLKTLQEMLEESVAKVFDIVTRDIHTPEALLHTSMQMKHRCSDFFGRKRALMLKLLQKAAQAGEISKSKANEETVLAIMMGTAPLYPPYYNNYSEAETKLSKSDLLKRASVLIRLIVAGLKKN